MCFPVVMRSNERIIQVNLFRKRGHTDVFDAEERFITTAHHPPTIITSVWFQPLEIFSVFKKSCEITAHNIPSCQNESELSACYLLSSRRTLRRAAYRSSESAEITSIDWSRGVGGFFHVLCFCDFRGRRSRVQQITGDAARQGRAVQRAEVSLSERPRLRQKKQRNQFLFPLRG